MWQRQNENGIDIRGGSVQRHSVRGGGPLSWGLNGSLSMRRRWRLSRKEGREKNFSTDGEWEGGGNVSELLTGLKGGRRKPMNAQERVDRGEKAVYSRRGEKRTEAKAALFWKVGQGRTQGTPWGGRRAGGEFFKGEEGDERSSQQQW